MLRRTAQQQARNNPRFTLNPTCQTVYSRGVGLE